MRVMVLGAQTPLGREVVEDLLVRGHEPTAVIDHSSAGAVVAQHPVSMARGDITDPEWVKAAVTGAQAVIDVLSTTRAREAASRARTATGPLLQAMTDQQARRYVGIAPHDLYPLPGSTPRFARVQQEVRAALHPGIAHTRERFQMIAGSPLNWTIVRTPTLTTGPARGVRHVRLRPDSFAKASLTQADAARFLAAQVLETGLLWTSPLISN